MRRTYWKRAVWALVLAAGCTDRRPAEVRLDLSGIFEARQEAADTAPPVLKTKVPFSFLGFGVWPVFVGRPSPEAGEAPERDPLALLAQIQPDPKTLTITMTVPSGTKDLVLVGGERAASGQIERLDYLGYKSRVELLPDEDVDVSIPFFPAGLVALTLRAPPEVVSALQELGQPFACRVRLFDAERAFYVELLLGVEGVPALHPSPHETLFGAGVYPAPASAYVLDPKVPCGMEDLVAAETQLVVTQSGRTTATIDLRPNRLQ